MNAVCCGGEENLNDNTSLCVNMTNARHASNILLFI